MAVNHVTFQGRLTKDIALAQTQSGITYTNFTLAWSQKYKEQEKKCFQLCKAWRQQAEFIDKYFHNKGTEMLVEGELNTEEWEKDGQKQSRNVLYVTQVHFCGKGNSNGQATPTGDTPTDGTQTVKDAEEPLPF